MPRGICPCQCCQPATNPPLKLFGVWQSTCCTWRRGTRRDWQQFLGPYRERAEHRPSLGLLCPRSPSIPQSAKVPATQCRAGPGQAQSESRPCPGHRIGSCLSRLTPEGPGALVGILRYCLAVPASQGMVSRLSATIRGARSTNGACDARHDDFAPQTQDTAKG